VDVVTYYVIKRANGQIVDEATDLRRLVFEYPDISFKITQSPTDRQLRVWGWDNAV
jgi:hypothetical protein